MLRGVYMQQMLVLETQYDIKLLSSQVQDDWKQGVIGAVLIPLEDAEKRS